MSSHQNDYIRERHSHNVAVFAKLNARKIAKKEAAEQQRLAKAARDLARKESKVKRESNKTGLDNLPTK